MTAPSFPTLLIWCVASFTMAGEPPRKADPEGKHAEKKHTPRYTIAKETTFVTGPRDKDGTIDHVSALNEILGKGVIVDTNAAALLWKAMGPRPEGGASMPVEFFKLMGIEAPPEKGDYYQDLFRFARERLKLDTMARSKELLDQMDVAGSGPWTAPQYPILAKWLAANENALTLVVEASQRPHYYSPLLPPRVDKDRHLLLAVLLPGVQKSRDLANALVIRAMLRMGEGKYEEAWQDLLTCHRLARLVARGATLIEGLVGVALDNIAANADLVFLNRARLTRKRICACLEDLQKLPAMPSLADKINLAERFMLLDLAVMVDRRGLDQLAELSGVFGMGVDGSFLPRTILDDVAWDPALRSINRWYDRLAAAVGNRERAVRKRKLEEMQKDLVGLRDKLSDPVTLLGLLQDKKATRETRGLLLADAAIVLLFPSVSKVSDAWDRNEQVQRNLQVAFALAAYRSENGHYPKKLTHLVPEYLNQIPLDAFTGKDLQYLTDREGYLLYSFGPNEMDDRGRWFDDEPRGDDPRVRMPLPPRR